MFINWCMCPSFRFGFEGGIWDLIVLIPDHCLSVYFPKYVSISNLLIFTSAGVVPFGGRKTAPRTS